MLQYKIMFDTIEWRSPIKGVKCKTYTYGNTQMRLIEYTKEMPPHWCEKGHQGLILEGEIEIEYSNKKIVYKKGDGVFIPEGPDHKHRGTALSEKVLVFFVEKI